MRARGFLSSLAAAALVALAAPAVQAGRIGAVPFAETLQAGRYSVWQFAVYEQKANKKWRLLNRLDLGAYEGVELGVFVVSPKDRAPDTWVNLQYRPVADGAHGPWTPTVAVGVWDAFRKDAPWFSSRAVGASPFLSVSKAAARNGRHAKLGLNLGANRLDGLSGGFDLMPIKGTGAQLEFIPRNLRLPGTDAWGAHVYQWIGPHFRVRISRLGGNLAFDGFFTWRFSGG